MNRSQRKLDHINHAIESNRQDEGSFNQIEIVHQSLSSLNWEDISLSAKLGELSLSSPFFVSAMTGGGGAKTEEINRLLARAAKETGIGMAVGSQMSAIANKEEVSSYRVARKENPSGIIFANIGSEANIEEVKQAIDMIEADALQIHLNTLQELLMPEGDRDFTERQKNIEKIVNAVPVPVIVKEVGYGISKETALTLRDIGVSYIDIAGKGGTNFSRVENERRQQALPSLNSWGIPSAYSLVEVLDAYPSCHLIASGGIKSGLDGAKALIVGAKAFGMAGTLLKTLLEQGYEALVNQIIGIHQELKMVMMMLNCQNPAQLKGKPVVYNREMKNWLEQRIN